MTFFAAARRDHPREALAHFGGGFVRKGDGEDVRRIDVLRDQIGDARGDDARFARAGAGEDQERTFGRGHGAALRVVEIEKAETGHGKGRVKVHRNRRLANTLPRCRYYLRPVWVSIRDLLRRECNNVMKTKLIALPLLALTGVVLSSCTTAQPTASIPPNDPRQGASDQQSILQPGRIAKAR